MRGKGEGEKGTIRHEDRRINNNESTQESGKTNKTSIGAQARQNVNDRTLHGKVTHTDRQAGSGGQTDRKGDRLRGRMT